uniref:Uncharacterized protein n=1 Tax=Ditylenchus dipsaci TaxID=166011 RepID=A0A915DSU8_9BILA
MRSLVLGVLIIPFLRTAGVVVAFVEFLLCVLAVYGLFRNLHIFGFPYLFWFIVGLISIFIILFAIVLLLYAIKKENSRLLIPHLSAQIFFILFMLIVVLVVALLLIFGAYKGIRRLLGHGDYYMSDDSTISLGYMIMAVYLALALLEIFFLYIIYKLYIYLREYKRLTNSPTGDSYYGSKSGQPFSSNEWYIGVTLHYCDASAILRRAFLGLQQLKGSHTGQLIRRETEKILAEYGLSLFNAFKVVTDAGSNMIKGFNEIRAVDIDPELISEEFEGALEEEVEDVEDNMELTDIDFFSSEGCHCL